MRFFLILQGALVLALVLPAGSALGQEAPAADEPAEAVVQEVEVSVYAVRIGRPAQAMRARFSQGMPAAVAEGVDLQLLLALREHAMLPLGPDDVLLENFVDDTYQDLLAPAREPTHRSQRPHAVSDDGRAVMLSFSSSRSPASAAERLFVRGTLQARLAKGEPQVDRARVPLAVGQRVEVGPFPVTVRAVIDQGQGSMSLNLGVGGDSARIRQIRLLSPGGQPLSVQRQGQRNVPAGQDAMFNMSINGGMEAVVIEMTHVTEVEAVRIPFEAQVDFGLARAGPVIKAQEPRADAAPRRWPPPPRQETRLPPRREAFDPQARPGAAEGEVGDFAVDLFALTVGKPPPQEHPEAQWAHPPSPSFRASGFTVARLMVSAPGRSILSVPADAVTFSKVEDDRGPILDPGIAPVVTSAVYRRGTPQDAAPDGQQAIVAVSMPRPPTPGATRISMAGTIKLEVAQGERAEAAQQPIAFSKGERFQIGPFQGSWTDVRQLPPAGPDQTAGAFQASIYIAGPLHRIRAIEVLDPATREVVGRRLGGLGTGDAEQQGASVELQLGSFNGENVLMQIVHFEGSELVEIPFDLSTGIGL